MNHEKHFSVKKLVLMFMHQLWKFKHQLIAFLGGQTVGARALVIRNQQILLVTHPYSRGWYTPGGGVLPGETTMEAMIRELQEEVGITVTEPPKMMNVYYSFNERRHDYVVMYVVSHFTQNISIKCNEIEKMQWFPLDQLPLNISPATKRRIQEYSGQRDISEHW